MSFGLLDYRGWPRRSLHSPRAERMTPKTPVRTQSDTNQIRSIGHRTLPAGGSGKVAASGARTTVGGLGVSAEDIVVTGEGGHAIEGKLMVRQLCSHNGQCSFKQPDGIGVPSFPCTPSIPTSYAVPAASACDGVTVTVDMTVHFRATPPRSPDRDGLALAVFRSRLGSEGYWEEDAVIWSPEGTVLAQARQLKLFPR